MPICNLNLAVDLSDEEITGLADSMGCPANQVEARLSSYAMAAFREYADMMLGVGTFSTAVELRERRLLGLIEIALAGQIPNVHRVEALFNIGPAAARALLRAVMSKHRRRLGAALKADVAAFLSACVQDPATGDWNVTNLNPVLIEILNDRLENTGQSKAKIRKRSDALGDYVVPNGSYQWIHAHP